MTKRSPPLPFARLRTGDGHRIAYAVAGAAHGAPVVVLHGGPGGASQPAALRLFDLARCRVVLVDQRGAGRSRPRGQLRGNRTERLIRDLETLRARLGIARWGVFGGSWGAALALAYAGTHPERVTGVVLRGLFLTSAREVRGLFTGSRRRAPRAWRRLLRAARCGGPLALATRVYATLRNGMPASRQRAVALAWRDYESALLAWGADTRSVARPRRLRNRAAAQRIVDSCRVQAHYLRHRCWLGPARLLALARRAAAHGVRFAAVHGTRDPVCPPGNLRRFSRAVPDARIALVRAGHLTSDRALFSRVAAELATMFATASGEGRAQRSAA